MTEPTEDMENIDVLPSGNLRVRVKFGGKVVASKTLPPDAIERARAFRNAVKIQLAAGNFELVEGVTMKQLGPRFLNSRLGNRNYKTDEGRWYKHIATAEWAQRPAHAITRSEGLAWLEQLEAKLTDYDPKRGAHEKKPLARSTRQACLVLARRAFVWAIDKGIIPPGTNPFIDLVVQKEDGDEEEGYQDGWYLDPMDQSYVITLYDCSTALDVRDRMEKWIAIVAWWSGVRQRELWCLHLDDVHAYDDEPHFWVRYGSWDSERERYRSPKGKKGEKKARRVELWGLGLFAMRKWLEEVRAEYVQPSAKHVERCASLKHSPLKLVFPTERGARRSNKPTRSFVKIASIVGIIPRIGRPLWWHLLRHTAASSMVSGWWGVVWGIQSVQKILGHTDIKTTQLYAHLAPSAVAAEATKAHAAFSSQGHAGVTAQRPAARKPLETRRARLDSNQRPTASETVTLSS